MPAPSERRRAPRTQVKRLTVLYHPQFDPRDVLHAQPDHKCVALDLSKFGLSIAVRFPLDPGVKLHLTLEVPALKQEIGLRGEVVRCVEIPARPGGEPSFALGISILHAEPDFHRLLERMQTDQRLRLGGF